MRKGRWKNCSTQSLYSIPEQRNHSTLLRTLFLFSSSPLSMFNFSLTLLLLLLSLLLVLLLLMSLFFPGKEGKCSRTPFITSAVLGVLGFRPEFGVFDLDRTRCCTSVYMRPLSRLRLASSACRFLMTWQVLRMRAIHVCTISRW